MDRTIISIQSDDKVWLMRQARAEHVSMAELIRRAIHQYRDQLKATSAKPSFKTLLIQTSGLWVHGDGLSYQEKLRQEWKERE